MLGVTHVLTGAAVGSSIENFSISFMLGIILHLVIFDKIPHFWPKEKSLKAWYLSLDWIFSFLIILFLLLKKVPIGAIGGATGGLFVDIFIITIPFVYRSRLGKWHTDRQPHRTKGTYLLTDAVVIIVSLILLKSWLF